MAGQAAAGPWWILWKGDTMQRIRSTERPQRAPGKGKNKTALKGPFQTEEAAISYGEYHVKNTGAKWGTLGEA